MLTETIDTVPIGVYNNADFRIYDYDNRVEKVNV